MPRPQRNALPAEPSVRDRTHLYVAMIHDNLKVGHASNLYLRISNMQVDSPYLVTVPYHVEVPKVLAARIEKYVHSHFEERWVMGEWFKISLEEARTAIAQMTDLVMSSRAWRRGDNGEYEVMR